MVWERRGEVAKSRRLYCKFVPGLEVNLKFLNSVELSLAGTRRQVGDDFDSVTDLTELLAGVSWCWEPD
jgi:hypothetical protein